MRLRAALEREQQSVDDCLALGLRLNGGEQSGVDDGLGGLRGEYFEQPQLALRKAPGAVGDVDEADQLALDLERHAQDRAYAPALCKLPVEARVRRRLVRDERLAGLVERSVKVLAFELEVKLLDQPRRRVT